MPYAPLPGGSGGVLPAVTSSCRPVLLGGVDLSMSAAVQPASAAPIDGGRGLMPRPLGDGGAHHPGAGDAPPNPDVLLALLARNKHLEGRLSTLKLSSKFTLEDSIYINVTPICVFYLM